MTGKCLTPDSPHEVPVGKDDPNQKEMYCDIRDAARYLKKVFFWIFCIFFFGFFGFFLGHFQFFWIFFALLY